MLPGVAILYSLTGVLDAVCRLLAWTLHQHPENAAVRMSHYF